MLSPFRTLTPVKSVKLHRVLAGSAVAVAAALAGSIAAWSTGLAPHSAGASQLAAASRLAPGSHPAGISDTAVSRGVALSRSLLNQTAAVTPADGSQAGAVSRSSFVRVQPPQLDAFLASPSKAQTTSGKGKAVRLTPRRIARRLLHRFHWGKRQFRYLNPLWDRESSWNVRASNPYSGAYGIPQAMPGSKMASAGPNWQGRARTQILWGLRYIRADYGSPRAAWEHELATGWY